MHIHGYQARHSLPSILHTPLSVLCSALKEKKKVYQTESRKSDLFHDNPEPHL